MQWSISTACRESTILHSTQPYTQYWRMASNLYPSDITSPVCYTVAISYTRRVLLKSVHNMCTIDHRTISSHGFDPIHTAF